MERDPQTCTHELGHLWRIGDDACVFCGQAWSGLYEIVVTPGADGAIVATPVARDVPTY